MCWTFAAAPARLSFEHRQRATARDGHRTAASRDARARRSPDGPNNDKAYICSRLTSLLCPSFLCLARRVACGQLVHCGQRWLTGTVIYGLHWYPDALMAGAACDCCSLCARCRQRGLRKRALDAQAARKGRRRSARQAARGSRQA